MNHASQAEGSRARSRASSRQNKRQSGPAGPPQQPRGEIPTRRTASISARTTPSKQSAPTPPGRLGPGQADKSDQPIQKGPPSSGGGTPAAPLQRAAWRTTGPQHQGQGRPQHHGRLRLGVPRRHHQQWRLSR